MKSSFAPGISDNMPHREVGEVVASTRRIKPKFASVNTDLDEHIILFGRTHGIADHRAVRWPISAQHRTANILTELL
jgi:hypothetical protein